MKLNLLIAGFGGQGVLFMGKVAAHTALLEDLFVSWLPSYGPEMRGGTANCAVCIDDKEISCPLITEPELLAVLNQPSFDRFAETVQPGGKIFLDSALIEVSQAQAARCAERGVSLYPIPCTSMAETEGLAGRANLIMLGKVLRETGFTSYDTLCEALKACIPASKEALLESNLKAVALGHSFGGR